MEAIKSPMSSGMGCYGILQHTLYEYFYSGTLNAVAVRVPLLASHEVIKNCNNFAFCSQRFLAHTSLPWHTYTILTMSTRAQNIRLTLDQYDDDVIEYIVDLPTDLKPHPSKSLPTKKNYRRQSRIPRSVLGDRGTAFLVTMAAAEKDDELSKGGSNHSSRSYKSLKGGMPNQQCRLSSEGRPRCRSMGRNRRRSTGPSADGGSKSRDYVTDDDAWQIFKEALSNMA
jgi:hypothetical protein